MSDETLKKIRAPLAKPNPAPVETAAAAAMEETISKSLMDLAMNADPNDLRGPDEVTEVAKGNTSLAHVWVVAPAIMKFSALTYRRLLKIEELSGRKNNEITYIQAKFIGDSKVLLLRPAPESDRTAYELHRYSNRTGVWCNLFDLMGSHGVTVPTGYRERYSVVYVPKESPLWPGLLIDLSDPKERKLDSKQNKKNANAATAQAKKTTEQAPAKPTTSTETSA